MRNLDRLEELERAFSDADASTTPAEKRDPRLLRTFLEEEIVTDSGPFSLKGREALRYPLDLVERTLARGIAGTEISILGAEQTFKTSFALGLAFHLVAELGHNVGYFVPTKEFAKNFGATRVRRMINRSPYLSERMRDRSQTNQVTVKEFDGNYLHILGLRSARADEGPGITSISVPLDDQLFDEVDLLSEEEIEWAKGRVAASSSRLRVFAAAGYVPEGGMALRFAEGTQHKFFVDCPKKKCLRRINLEEVFPESMTAEGVRVCPKCKSPVDLTKGEWIATYPDRARYRRYSFRVSSLIVGARDGAHIMDRWRTAKRTRSGIAKFDCAERAITNAGALKPVGEPELAAMRRPFTFKYAQSGRPRYGGLDVGDACHLWVHEEDDRRGPVLVWLEEIDADKIEETIARRIADLGIVSFVMDFFPERTLARALAYRFPKIVTLARFTEGRPLTPDEEEHAGKSYQIVVVDRNDALDEFTGRITDATRGLHIPDKERLSARDFEIVEMAEDHFNHLRKECVVTKEGKKVYRYVHGVANHLAFAGCYADVAQQIAVTPMPFKARIVERDRVFGDQTRLPRRRAGDWKRGVMGG